MVTIGGRFLIYFHISVHQVQQRLKELVLIIKVDLSNPNLNHHILTIHSYWKTCKTIFRELKLLVLTMKNILIKPRLILMSLQRVYSELKKYMVLISVYLIKYLQNDIQIIYKKLWTEVLMTSIRLLTRTLILTKHFRLHP